MELCDVLYTGSRTGNVTLCVWIWNVNYVGHVGKHNQPLAAMQNNYWKHGIAIVGTLLNNRSYTHAL